MNEDQLSSAVQVGRILHFVSPESGVCLAAIAVSTSTAMGYVDLQVFQNLDMDNRFESLVPPSRKAKLARSWHWPRECDFIAKR